MRKCHDATLTLHPGGGKCPAGLGVTWCLVVALGVLTVVPVAIFGWRWESPAVSMAAALLALIAFGLLARVSRESIGRLVTAVATIDDDSPLPAVALPRWAPVELRRLRDAIQQLRTRLRDLDISNRDLQLMLESSGQAMMLIAPDGIVAEIRSKRIVEWFGDAPAHTKIWTLIGAVAPSIGAALEDGWGLMGAGIVSNEEIIERLPQELTVGARHLRLSFKPGTTGERAGWVMLVVSDVTAEIERKQADDDRKELIALLNAVRSDRTGVVHFINEAIDLVFTITTTDPPPPSAAVLRALHTLKGNAALFGLERLCNLCHSLETKIEEEGGPLKPLDIDAVSDCWDQSASRIIGLMRENPLGVIELHENEHQQLIAALESGAPVGEVLDLAKGWVNEPLEVQFHRMSAAAQAVSRKLGKGSLGIETSVPRIRLPREPWGELWNSLTLVLTNAVDHGLEEPAVRRATGKREQGTLELKAEVISGALELSIRDDGQGIDWERVSEMARIHNLPHESEADLVEALFSDGLTTRTEVTSTSGRGIGLAAVREVCRRLGVTIAVSSKRGRGTTFTFRLPELNSQQRPAGPAASILSLAAAQRDEREAPFSAPLPGARATRSAATSENAT